MLKVKICGNRSLEEILMAARSGADAIGLIVGARHHTEDDLDSDTAAKLLQATPIFTSSVLVTHCLSAEEILNIYKQVPTTTIQLHDDIAIDQVNIIRQRLPGVPLIKAIHVEDETALEEARVFAHFADALLLDSRTEDRIGGTGHVHDWSISSRIVSSVEKPVMLAGGLTPQNVVEAIKQVKPYGVDVNSGVEFSDGRKNPDKIKDFIRLAKFCDFQ